MAAPEILHQPRRRIHHQGGAADDHQVRLADIVDGPGQHVLVQALLIQHHIGLDVPAAGGAPGDAGGREDGVQAVKGPAFFAVVPQNTAVQLQHLPVMELLRDQRICRSLSRTVPFPVLYLSIYRPRHTMEMF